MSFNSAHVGDMAQAATIKCLIMEFAMIEPFEDVLNSIDSVLPLKGGDNIHTLSIR